MPVGPPVGGRCCPGVFSETNINSQAENRTSSGPQTGPAPRAGAGHAANAQHYQPPVPELWAPLGLAPADEVEVPTAPRPCLSPHCPLGPEHPGPTQLRGATGTVTPRARSSPLPHSHRPHEEFLITVVGDRLGSKSLGVSETGQALLSSEHCQGDEQDTRKPLGRAQQGTLASSPGQSRGVGGE